MVVHAPELLGETSDIALVSQDLIPEPQALQSAFLLLARLECSSALLGAPESLALQIDQSIRNELRSVASLRLLSKAVLHWSSYDRFVQALLDGLTPSERDRLQVEFALTQVTITQLFDSAVSWPTLRALGEHGFEKLALSQGGVNALDALLRGSYRRQRDSLLRELFLRALPTAVLWIAGFVAVAMALSFTRSLVSG